MLSMIEYVHQRIKAYPSGLIGVDMTMGNGCDTVFLAEHCQEVYAFDIQEQALLKTQEKVKDLSNVHLILDNHENIDLYFHSFDIGIFNLGYLPGLNHQTTTVLSSTKVAIKKAIKMMNEVLFIVVYVYRCFACMYVCAPHACSALRDQRGHHIPWNWNDR